jgi:hypothetical protein
MLLTRIEQEKLQSYVIKNMIKEHQQLRNLLDDPDLELQFIEYMIEKKYKAAFELCLSIDNVWLNFNQIQIIINYLDPTINQEISKYYIFDQTNDTNNSKLFNQIYTSIQNKLNKICSIIFD